MGRTEESFSCKLLPSGIIPRSAFAQGDSLFRLCVTKKQKKTKTCCITESFTYNINMINAIFDILPCIRPSGMFSVAKS